MEVRFKSGANAAFGVRVTPSASTKRAVYEATVDMKQMQVFNPAVELIAEANATEFDKKKVSIPSFVSSGKCARFAVSDEMSEALQLLKKLDNFMPCIRDVLVNGFKPKRKPNMKLARERYNKK